MSSRIVLLLACLAACDAKNEEVAGLRQEVVRIEQEVAATRRSLVQVEEKLAAVQAEVKARAPAVAEPGSSTLAIADDGGLKLDGAPVEAAALQARLCELATARPGVALSITASPKVAHAQVVQALDAARACSIARVAIASGP